LTTIGKFKLKHYAGVA